ncbi:hypothetical protein DICSQDRAFT_135679 [Dichomitus squalens LYAD-421 SS1]|uniref:uncharacterized protein n=1 Tax=Dichomitus squalens (strain LYAD-421) TaxID=732165 RepID=UPI0004414F26|nr:uncharacterized protein DICSQDRAFT_135679 [Dichomitus squalens LYAD-421 SS1]EJF62707.1 hypothetical protein DICSQDRAFT_135679 [Dichomitus squalens LYAD-421 SS1]
MKAPTALQRGMACLCCRKRKMKCDGARPICTQCSKASRADECQYYEKKRTSRTQLLQAKITKLEARLRELEAEQSAPESSSSSGSQSPQLDRLSVPLSQHDEFTQGFDPTSIFNNTPGLEYLGNSDAFPHFDEEFFPNISAFGGLPWTGDGLDFQSVDDMLAPDSSESSKSSLREFPSGHSMNWWENDVFCENKQMLLDIFFAHRHQCAFDVHIGRFRAALLLPSAQQPHPSLVDAIYLLACYFSRSPSLTELEPHFLKRSLRGISEALQLSDRIVHVLQASCLLAVYFFWHGRTLEGYYHSSIAARLAVGLGLHQISSKENFRFQMQRASYQDAPAPLKASVPLSPPLDEVEYAERIAAFWQIFAVDRAWSVATGLPTALPDDDHPRSRITTIWPIVIPDDPEPSIENSLMQPFPATHLSGSSALQALRVKAIALYERTARYSASPAKDDSHYSLEMSLSQFSSNLSSLHAQQFSMPYMTTPDYVTLQSGVYASTIHLHRDDLEIQTQSYQKCCYAASSMIALLHQLAENDYDALSPMISTCWRAAAEVYLRVLAMPRQSLPTTVDVLEQQIDTLVGAMQRLSLLFPVAGIYAAKVQEDRAAARQAYLSSVV